MLTKFTLIFVYKIIKFPIFAIFFLKNGFVKKKFPFLLVKIWSTNMDHSITSLEAKANVCCVKFNPESSFHLAFGSAGMSIFD